jgi:hypothetical protein
VVWGRDSPGRSGGLPRLGVAVVLMTRRVLRRAISPGCVPVAGLVEREQACGPMTVTVSASSSCVRAVGTMVRSAVPIRVAHAGGAGGTFTAGIAAGFCRSDRIGGLRGQSRAPTIEANLGRGGEGDRARRGNRAELARPRRRRQAQVDDARPRRDSASTTGMTYPVSIAPPLPWARVST